MDIYIISHKNDGFFLSSSNCSAILSRAEQQLGKRQENCFYHRVFVLDTREHYSWLLPIKLLLISSSTMLLSPLQVHEHSAGRHHIIVDIMFIVRSGPESISVAICTTQSNNSRSSNIILLYYYSTTLCQTRTRTSRVELQS